MIDFIINAPIDGFEFQNEVDVLCRHKLRQGLESLLDKYSNIEEVIRIDVLFAEVDYSSVHDFENSFTEKILNEVEKILLQKLASSSTSTDKDGVSTANKLINLFVFYLEKGFLPWWTSVKTSQEWHEELMNLLSQEYKNANWMGLYLALRNENVRTRLLESFNQQQFWKLMENISTANMASLKADLEIILASIKTEKHERELKLVFNHILLCSIADVTSSNIVVEVFSNRLVRALKSKYKKLLYIIPSSKLSTPELKVFVEKEIESQKAEDLRSSTETDIIPDIIQNEESLITDQYPTQNSGIEKEDIYINNAGLVIAAAYLPMFFRDLGLISEADNLDVLKAIAVMQYMVKGLDEYEEFETVLPKILCGVELNKPISKKKLNKKEKQKVNELLESIIEHWTVLKNTSTEGLRLSFLQREGRLVFKNNEWSLKVQQESYDMLLSHLPWNINLIKLPWMNYLLHVEWA